MIVFTTEALTEQHKEDLLAERVNIGHSVWKSSVSKHANIFVQRLL